MMLKDLKTLLEQAVAPPDEKVPQEETAPPTEDPANLPDVEGAPTQDEAMPSPNDPNAMADPTMADPAMGGGMGVDSQPLLSPLDIGHGYELKKIHERLVSLESYLSSVSDIELLKLRTLVMEALDLFQIIVSNFNSYKENIEEIIIMFYRFIDECYEIFRQFLAKKIKEKEKEKKVKKTKKLDNEFKIKGL